ncbi:YolD-like family protein [Paenibacillus oryzisoli]|uniref:YolD-like family protein n=1 Tax=Paenibacillus oryzisoli TaxID=1850517 RepID=A0A198AK15_9BACL|nr:YolD-like family protein [Paenibacillus oryzisoli]OAS21381.1 hypothetical protein A8708_31430 [Paenibacillus oryzisoli]
MGKKLQSNGIWESSRFIGPEFKESIRLQQREHKRVPRTVLDLQEVQLISGLLSQSQMYKKIIQLTLYDEFQTRTLTGIVSRSQRDSFRLDSVDPFNGNEDSEWILYQDVIKAELSKEWTEDEMIDP